LGLVLNIKGLKKNRIREFEFETSFQFIYFMNEYLKRFKIILIFNLFLVKLRYIGEGIYLITWEGEVFSNQFCNYPIILHALHI